MTDSEKGPGSGPSTQHEEVPVWTVPTGVHIKSEAEKRLVRKQDFLITTLLSGCFFFAYLDRGAIGNARIMGFQAALGLTDRQYFNCLMMFYVGYMAFEFPVFIMIRRFHAPTVYALSVIAFGVAGLCTAYAKTYAQVLVLRLILGCGEAAVQTSFLFVSLWYRREELGTRCGYVYCTTPVAGAIAGLIAYGVGQNLDRGPSHLAPWQWLFIIEGIPTIAWGLLVWVLLPQFPENEVESKRSIFFKREEEKKLILERAVAAHYALHSKMRPFQMWLAIKDPKVWMMALGVATHATALAGFGVFLPTFFREFGFDRLTSQLYTIIPYSCAFIALLFVSYASDRIRMRAVPLLGLTALAIVGFIIMLATPNATAGIVGACLISTAVYPAIVLFAAWMPSNNAGYTKRATATWISQITIQTFSIMASQIYDKPPRFFTGHGTLLGLFVLTFVFILVIVLLMKLDNRKKEEAARQFEATGR
ncbi:unnamed protein product [Parascedosporium putredinis]|uniref:Major facilitator superfamily (MFS) profile domain-containing protein n=1 Tax=Parascedosporium putredinis TaxID=1442378 RepID=A0A9P1H2S7_9PEZI|nr:unnamed protein product [Parascedosporium putredinis]CAI7994332.1 unnamed protein product [Parascedosporium putredinis]